MTTLLKINKKIYYYFRKSDKNHFKKKLKINIKTLCTYLQFILQEFNDFFFLQCLLLVKFQCTCLPNLLTQAGVKIFPK